MPERDLVDEITATLDEAERLQDHFHILIALKRLKEDFSNSQSWQQYDEERQITVEESYTKMSKKI